MQSEMSRARYASSHGKDSLNYRVVAATKASGDDIRIGIVFQEYVFDRDETHLSPFKRRSNGCENNGEVKRLSQVIYVMCADSSFDTCRYLIMKDSQRPVVTPRNFTSPRKAHCARRSRSLMVFSIFLEQSFPFWVFYSL